MNYDSLPERIKNGIRVFEDGATVIIPLPDIGFQNMYDQGLSGTYLSANYFTLATYISTEVPNFMHKLIGDAGSFVYAVQTILIVKPHFHTIVPPFKTWDEFESIIDLVSFYRSSLITNQTIRVKSTQMVIAQVLAKLIVMNSMTKRPEHISEMFSTRFSKYFNKPHPEFKDVKSYLEMNKNMTKDIIKSLFVESNDTTEVYKINLIVNESDHDWNHHLSNSVYIRICGDCLKQAISRNDTFKKTLGPHRENLMISRMDNSYLKECKAGDELKVLCILHIPNPLKLEFRIFRMANLDEDIRIVYIGQMEISFDRSKL